MRRGPKFSFFLPTIFLCAAALSVCALACAEDASKPGEPTEAKARQTWENALNWEKKGFPNLAIDGLIQANKEDGGHCSECLRRAYSIAITAGQFKDAAEAAHDWLAMAHTAPEQAAIHIKIGDALTKQGMLLKKKQLFAQSCDEYKTALSLDAKASLAHFGYGIALANLRQEKEARAEFQNFLGSDHEHPQLHMRAERYIERIDLARLPLAPDFNVTTSDGSTLSRDSLAGKVVLIDFWATWCSPCRASIPTIAKFADEFANRPFVILSVNLDRDAGAWKSFVRRNAMNWPQYHDGDFDGQMSKLFGVRAIPATFTIGADGILEDQRVGDTEIEGKLKKMIAQAEQIAAQHRTAADQSKKSAQ